ncbi:MAG: MoxR family ATPase [Spirochaetaceae bacterium]|nr:MoxR family ATPase [Spirochaetaceae bacterium]MBR4823924.1 MoxR family ATPase [Spirochaetaceae bacterium]
MSEKCRSLGESCRAEAAKRIVGQTELLDGILTAIIADGHVLLEGVPGLAKTLAVKTFADMSGLAFKRIQFTPDLLPADVTGTLIYEQATGNFSVRQGPVFTNLLLADEINRAPAKVQSALLEAMAERQVTIGEKTYALPKPFLVLATQNPIEQEGTYNLPEAELDRFLMKLHVSYPTNEEEFSIIKQSAQASDPSKIKLEQILSAETIAQMRQALPSVACDDKIIEYIVSIVSVTRPEQKAKNKAADRASHGARREDFLRYITFGASPRAGIALQKCAKAQALLDGRTYVLPDDVKKVVPAVLRHRLVLSYEAAADGLTTDDIITKILATLPVP